MSAALLAAFLPAAGQTNGCEGSRKVGCLLPNLGGSAFTLPNNFHRAHFSSVVQENFTPMTSAVASQLSRLPLTSTASGFTYNFDTGLGVYTRTAQSFGPILAERAETIGKRRVQLGVSFQRYTFDRIDGIDLNSLPAVFVHSDDPPGNFQFKEDFITTSNNIDFRVNQWTVFGTVGITDRLDVAVAVPILDVRLGITSAATIQRVAPPDPVFGQAHYFDANNPNGSLSQSFGTSASASGIGDITLRLKGTVFKRERTAVAVAADVRAPSGDEMNLLGSGALGVRPFVAASTYWGRFAPHANLGFQWNGRSVLAGNVATRQKAKLPNQLIWAVGTDVGVARRLTLAFDVLGQRVNNGERVFSAAYAAPAPISQSFQNTWVGRESFNMVDAAVGGKVNLTRTLLLTANVLFRLNEAGLRDDAVPLVGLAYTF